MFKACLSLVLVVTSPAALLAQECGSVTRIDHEFASLSFPDSLQIVDVSANGNIFIAGGHTDIFSGVHHQAFLWSESGGQTLLNYDGYDVYPTCISADGSVVAGHGRNGFSGSPTENKVFVWGPNGGFIEPDSYIESEVFGMSADGLVLVGWNRPMVPPFAPRPYRWTPSTGMVDLGIIQGAERGYADAVSGDGLVVVGRSIDSTNTTFPILWDASGLTLLGSRDARATALSFDGSVVVGNTVSVTGTGNRAFRWTAATGLVEIPLPPGHVQSTADDISDDGTVIIGRVVSGQGVTSVYRLSATNGYQYVTDALGTGSGGLGMSGDASTVFRGDRVWRKDRAITFCPQVAMSPCVPSIQFSGTPSLSASTPFEVTLPSAPTNAFGLFFYSSSSPARIAGPFGDLCVSGPYVRLGILNAGGSPQQGPCAGMFVVDFNAYLQSTAPHALSAGDSVVGQFWYRDSASAIGATWSDAVAIPICP